MVKRRININLVKIISFISLLSFLIPIMCSYPRDLREIFEVVSPEYVKQINYIRKQPPFKITAPEGWYVALNKDEVEKAGEPRAVFCKYHPGPYLARGNFGFPFIEVKFWPNPENKSSLMWADDIVSEMRRKGMEGISAPEAIQVKNYKGAHFTLPHPSGLYVSDSYIFEGEGYFVSIITYYEPGKSIATETKEVIDSIDFSGL